VVYLYPFRYDWDYSSQFQNLKTMVAILSHLTSTLEVELIKLMLKNREPILNETRLHLLPLVLHI
jgi:hypothetical protein